MEEVSIIGIDLAKRSFQMHGARADGSVAFRRKLSRGRLPRFLASQPNDLGHASGPPHMLCRGRSGRGPQDSYRSKCFPLGTGSQRARTRALRVIARTRPPTSLEDPADARLRLPQRRSRQQVPRSVRRRCARACHPPIASWPRLAARRKPDSSERSSALSRLGYPVGKSRPWRAKQWRSRWSSPVATTGSRRRCGRARPTGTEP
jgi:hypothetical protein